ncbi:fluoride efflux transporter CrcB [Hanamia caeni]|jgi:CrcB protein|uniref:Fluoride-specific ion channel FluC n=1 Tax=Hanamia caeni TaxID=2294116 RepID=A0A3M9NFV6_9BACT|nr:fluoride efflux transporter CrcB [Hanamia caeni]RNI36666.1 fluoride efflux transporter CrcB [Hanamia caeni]
MKIILAVGLGSFIGGICRYLVTLFIQNKFLTTFPFGTMFVNVLGCFLIGIIYALSDRGSLSPLWRMFLATGMMGGFTTFSTFSNETVSMLRDAEYVPAFSYIAFSIIIGLAATIGGISLIKYL